MFLVVSRALSLGRHGDVGHRCDQVARDLVKSELAIRGEGKVIRAFRKTPNITRYDAGRGRPGDMGRG